MPSHISLQPMTQDTIKRARSPEKSHPGLPPEVLQDIARRLQFICLVMVGYSLVSLVANFAVASNHAYFELSVGVRVGVSLLVWWIVRRGQLSAFRLIDLGLAYEVVMALVLSFTNVPFTWGSGARSTLLWSVGHVLVMIYPVVVPSLTGRALIAATLSAVTVPAAVAFYTAMGVIPAPGIGAYLRLGVQCVGAVAVAVGVSRIQYRMGEQLARAKAMGSYHLGELLGKGGMGEVWSATHKFLARPAAVKLVRRDQIGESNEQNATEVLQRFEREAQATAALQSPHTVSVYDFGIARDGTFYYVMELLDGLDLNALISRDGPQKPERVVHILRQACHSLFEAHERGLVHRDIKPANIFLCRYATEPDFVKVLDFGLAKNVDTSARPGMQVTMVGMIAGTPGFIAPEAAAGLGGVDGRSDLYALGCVAYWLLSGQQVFEGSSPMTILVAHMKDDPPPLSSKAAQPIPAGLERIIMNLLEKDPAKRPQTARELSNRLEALDLEKLWTSTRAEEWWTGYRAGDVKKPAPTLDVSGATTRKVIAPDS